MSLKPPSRHSPVEGGFPVEDDFLMAALKLDRIDLNILSQLQRNGRITNIDLAKAVALSPSP